MMTDEHKQIMQGIDDLRRAIAAVQSRLDAIETRIGREEADLTAEARGGQVTALRNQEEEAKGERMRS